MIVAVHLIDGCAYVTTRHNDVYKITANDWAPYNEVTIEKLTFEEKERLKCLLVK